MLDPYEKQTFDGLVARLEADDPRFRRRIGRLSRPRRWSRKAFAIALWTLAPVCVVFGGWTGLLMAVVAASYGALLMSRRNAPGWDAAGGGRRAGGRQAHPRSDSAP